MKILGTKTGFIPLKLIFLTLLVLSFSTVMSQLLYFNEVIDLEGNWGSGNAVLSNDTSYLINAITGPGKKVTLINLDSNGSTIWIKNMEDQASIGIRASTDQ